MPNTAAVPPSLSSPRDLVARIWIDAHVRSSPISLSVVIRPSRDGMRESEVAARLYEMAGQLERISLEVGGGWAVRPDARTGELVVEAVGGTSAQLEQACEVVLQILRR